MCSICSSIFEPTYTMENYQALGGDDGGGSGGGVGSGLGDLTDIVRASSTGAYGSCTTLTSTSSEAHHQYPLSAHDNHDHNTWQFSSSFDSMNFSSILDEPRDNFGDPFSNMRDPFLHQLQVSGSGFYNTTTNSSANQLISTGGVVIEEAAAGLIGSGGGRGGGGGTVLSDDIKRPSNILSQMIQISPNTKLPATAAAVMAVNSPPRGVKASAMVSNDMSINVNSSTSKVCNLIDNNSGVQIQSPRNPGLKRRKSQAKKVVCIPAPATSNSRPTGEVVPSDLWAWRKYGQKPIKGSPYPRGYYRCSSSKGCSARKQVERSRTDPNMLVITYTSEHNHPWPTQRNALAGSTRSQPTKTNAAAGSKNSSTSNQSQKSTKHSKEEQGHESNSDSNLSPIVAGGNLAHNASVKEEIEDIEKQMEMDDGEFSDGLPYKPSMLESSNQSEDFFADLGEIEADPLNLLFTQGFTADEQKEINKDLDPFNLFDWPGDNSTTNANTSFGEAKRGL